MAKNKKGPPRHDGPAFTHLASPELDFQIIAGEQLPGIAVEEFIHRRRRQLIIHSIIYYRFDENIVSDDAWQIWADELAKVQNHYPSCCKIGFYDDDFKDWTGATGHDLDLYTLESTARALLTEHYKEKTE